MAEKKEIKKKGANRFKKGQSGNPAGRKPGIEDKRTKYRKLMGEHATDLVNKCLHAALVEGDKTMLKVCIDKLLPNAKSERIVAGVLKGIDKSDIRSLQEASKSVVNAMSKDDITPDQGKSAMDVIERHAQMVDRTEIIERLERIEGKLK
jgi:hypothetical protein